MPVSLPPGSDARAARAVPQRARTERRSHDGRGAQPDEHLEAALRVLRITLAALGDVDRG
ncbi:hypothetical protein GCM10028787_12330 [Brachybacterium horti]